MPTGLMTLVAGAMLRLATRASAFSRRLVRRRGGLGAARLALGLSKVVLAGADRVCGAALSRRRGRGLKGRVR